MNTTALMIAVVIMFTTIHLVEVLSFFARISGVRLGMRASAYTLQNSVFMITRLFSMLMLPVMGYIVDFGVDKTSYITMMIAAFLGASSAGILATLNRSRIVQAFTEILENLSAGRGLLTSLAMFPLFFARGARSNIALPIGIKGVKTSLFFMSSAVFSTYAVSILFMFYMGLLYPQYRMTISQLSGITNALAAVVLTFFIEPRISLSVDSEGSDTSNSTDLIMTLILGRIFGVGIISPVFVLLVTSL